MNQPILITQTSFQLAWKDVISQLSIHNWDLYNLVVHIEDPTGFEICFHGEVGRFGSQHSLLGPKDVAYTIFPHGLYKRKGSAEKLFEAYGREGGMYQRVRTRWGTYFRRMTCYKTKEGVVNQLGNVIKAINERKMVWKAAHTVIIQRPGNETVRPLGGPCLNYLAVQMKPTDSHPVLGMLCVYRNHDILVRAYGNYWGLCNLACFLAQETNSVPGSITCVSSHAYIDRLRAPIKDLIDRV
jgi:thymidylate synthase